jgi:hypothetical protein
MVAFYRKPIDRINRIFQDLQDYFGDDFLSVLILLILLNPVNPVN